MTPINSRNMPKKECLKLLVGMFLVLQIYTPAQSQTIRLKSSEGYLQTEDSVHLFYKILGEGKDTILVVHGGFYNSGYLSPDLTPLAAHHTLLFYDMRASGYSSLLKDTAKLGISDHVNDIEIIRKHFQLKKLTLMAHSMGGIISGYYAVVYPERVKSMILINPIPAKAEWEMNFDSKLPILTH